MGSYVANYSLFSLSLCSLLEELLCASEEELLREALRQAKVILSTRLPIDFLPMVLESKDLISSAECQMIKGERNDVEKSLKLLDMIEKKSIPAIQTFLGILKSNKNMRGYGYLAEMVERDCAALVGKKAVTSDGKPSSILIIMGLRR